MKTQTLTIYRNQYGQFTKKPSFNSRRTENAEYFQNVRKRNLQKQQEENIHCMILTVKTLIVIVLVCSIIKILSNLLGWA